MVFQSDFENEFLNIVHVHLQGSENIWTELQSTMKNIYLGTVSGHNAMGNWCMLTGPEVGLSS